MSRNRCCVLVAILVVGTASAESRYRARELGIEVGVLQPGDRNAITDVEGVKVGHVTVVEGSEIRTGVTAILPHGDNVFLQKVPAAAYVGNGFGKLMGSTQIEELGNLETPILLTSTLNVPRVADALLDYMLGLPGMEGVRSINPVVGETNDGYLNEIRYRRIGGKEVFNAIRSASSGAVQEGSVGAGTGTVCFGFKGGIGTSSRVLPSSLAGYRVGVLVQTNFQGVLRIGGAPVGKELGRYYLRRKLQDSADSCGDGSCMIVVATDAPLDSRNLKRLARRAMLGLAVTGGTSTSGSGDYVLAFSTAKGLRIYHSSAGKPVQERMLRGKLLRNEDTSPLFQAVKEATEEAIYNSILMATSVTGRDGHSVEPIPLDRVFQILKKYGVIPGDFPFPGERAR
ncbi:MAG: P1 family peptidase [Acidobacteriota bacterium]